MYYCWISRWSCWTLPFARIPSFALELELAKLSLPLCSSRSWLIKSEGQNIQFILLTQVSVGFSQLHECIWCFNIESQMPGYRLVLSPFYVGLHIRQHISSNFHCPSPGPLEQVRSLISVSDTDNQPPIQPPTFVCLTFSG